MLWSGTPHCSMSVTPCSSRACQMGTLSDHFCLLGARDIMSVASVLRTRLPLARACLAAVHGDADNQKPLLGFLATVSALGLSLSLASQLASPAAHCLEIPIAEEVQAALHHAKCEDFKAWLTSAGADLEAVRLQSADPVSPM